MDDKIRVRLESAVHKAVANNLDQIINGKKVLGIIDAIEEAVASESVVPACALRKTDDGLVFITRPEILLHKTAADLRSDGMIVANAIPDCAQVVRAKSGLVFSWKSNQIIDVDNLPPP